MAGCAEDKSGENGGPKKPLPPQKFKAIAPAFSADSAYEFIEKQLDFGPRTPNSVAHENCAAWYKVKFEEYGAQVMFQEAVVEAYDRTKFAIKNVIAAYNPKNERRILVTAHWDSRPMADKDPDHPTLPVPAANDGASGVAVILEIARQFSLKAPEIGVDLILWDAEDYGSYNDNDSWCLGSQHWCKNVHRPNYRPKFGINLDMVGAKDARFSVDGYSKQYASTQGQMLWNIAHNLGFGQYFPLQDYGFQSIDDHLVIMNCQGIPMIEIIDRNTTTGEFFPHWHKTTDDITHIDKATLKAVGQTVLEVLYREK